MRTYWDFHSAGKLLFGSGVLKQFPVELKRNGYTRPLIITDRNIVQAGLLERLKLALGDSVEHLRVFDGGEAEPSLKAAQLAREAANETAPDVIIGLGGGSNLDLAKITALLHCHGGQPADYFGFDQVPGSVTPLICIPTTAGTGSEVSHAAVLTDTESGLKVSTLSAHLRPSLALVDPALTETCPARVTAESGMDALTHAIEAYTCRLPLEMKEDDDVMMPYPGKNPVSDAFAEKAIRLVARHLVRAVKHPSDTIAREGMALAATLAGLAFSNGAVAVVHALEYPMGVALHCSHGQGNGLLLPYVMRFNKPARLEEFASIADFLGCDIEGVSREEAAELGILAVEKLKETVGIPRGIRDIGGKDTQLEGFADKSHQISRLMNINPIQPSKDDLLSILKAAF
jgi:alcohol dehydrogenase class IV